MNLKLNILKYTSFVRCTAYVVFPYSIVIKFTLAPVSIDHFGIFEVRKLINKHLINVNNYLSFANNIKFFDLKLTIEKLQLLLT